MPPTPSTPENSTPFESLLVDLVRAGVEFAVVGGVAVSLNGFVRSTDDLDILVDENPDNIRKLLACLRGWGEGWARELTPDDFRPQEGSVRVTEDFELDIFTRMRGHSLAGFHSHVRRLDASGVAIPCLDAEALIQLKRDSWREKDRIDVEALTRIARR